MATEKLTKEIHARLTENDYNYLKNIQETFGLDSTSDAIRLLIRVFRIGVTLGFVDIDKLGKVLGCILAMKDDDVFDKIREQLSHKDL